MFSTVKDRILSFLQIQPSISSTIKRYEKRIKILSDGCIPVKNLISEFNIQKNIAKHEIKILTTKMSGTKEEKEQETLTKKISMQQSKIDNIEAYLYDLEKFLFNFNEITEKLRNQVNDYQTKHVIIANKMKATAAFRSKSSDIRDNVNYMDEHFLKMEARAKAELDTMRDFMFKKNPYEELEH